MTSFWEKVSSFIMAVLLVGLLMGLFPILLHYFETSQRVEQEVSRIRVKAAHIVKEEPPKETRELHLRSTRSKTIPSASRSDHPFQFTPDLTVGSEGGAAVEMAELETMLFEENEIDVSPRALFIAPLKYPERARNVGIEGIVSIIIVVARDGSVENVFFEKIPDPLFRRSIETQVRRWKFHPGKKNGVPVRVKVRQSVEFKLE